MKSSTVANSVIFTTILALVSQSVSSPVGTLIVGGSNAQLKQFPYQAVLLKPSLLRPVICGASILDQRYLLTAAHCVYEQNPIQFTVRVGQVHLDANLTQPYEQEIPVNEFIIHPQYSPSRFLNDIAIIELSSALVLDGEYVAPIGLPVEVQEEIVPGSECRVAGWGATVEGGETQRELMYAFLPSMTDDTCRLRYPNYVHNSMFCVGFPAGGVDVCFGDSGGPLSCDGGNTIHGIVSWGDGGCAHPDTPSVHTQVSYFIEWIQSVIS